MPRMHARRGAIAIEITLNMLIYTLVFMVLFQLAVVPFQQFYLQTASRSAALLYVQLRHSEGALSTQQTLVHEMLPNSKLDVALEEKAKGKGSTASESLPLVTTQDLVTYYVKMDLFGDTTLLPGRLFDASKINVKYEISPEEHAGSFGRLADYLVNLVITRKVTVTVAYSKEFVQGFSGLLPPVSFKGDYTCGYAP